MRAAGAGAPWPVGDGLVVGTGPRPLAGTGRGNLSMWVIGMEQGLSPAPVPAQTLLLAPGERADVIVDFRGRGRAPHSR